MLLLSTFASLCSSGCIVPESPDYSAPQQTRPEIEQLSAFPNIFYPLVVPETGAATTFSVRIRSEDAGERLYLVFYVDYQSPSARQRVEDRSWPPSTFDKANDVTIEVQLTTKNIPSGCHTLTLLAMHNSTWDDAIDLPRSDRLADDVGSLTWWLNVRPVDSDVLEGCPTGSEVITP